MNYNPFGKVIAFDLKIIKTIIDPNIIDSTILLYDKFILYLVIKYVADATKMSKTIFFVLILRTIFTH